MLDHMIFNKLKWFNIGDNVDQVTANGKSYTAIPKQIKVQNRASIMWASSGDHSISDTLSCCGIFYGTFFGIDGNHTWYVVQQDSWVGWTNEQNIKNVIWGGKSFYMLVWRAFITYLKGVKAC